MDYPLLYTTEKSRSKLIFLNFMWLLENMYIDQQKRSLTWINNSIFQGSQKNRITQDRITELGGFWEVF